MEESRKCIARKRASRNTHSVAQWRNGLNFGRSTKSSNPVMPLLCSSSLSCMNEYLAIHSGGYLGTNILGAIIAAWLDASKRSRNGVQFNRSIRQEI